MQIDLLATGMPLFSMIWNIFQAERTLPQNKLGQGDVAKHPAST